MTKLRPQWSNLGIYFELVTDVTVYQHQWNENAGTSDTAHDSAGLLNIRGKNHRLRNLSCYPICFVSVADGPSFFM